jgi:4-hydroxybenzoate polyprenyltransferase
METFLKLIRWKNLLIIAITMFAMRYAVIAPVYAYFGISLALSKYSFLFLALAIIFLVAGANVINDYFDRRSDMINRPKEVLVVFSIRRRKTIIIHAMFSLLGIICGFMVSHNIGRPSLGFLFILGAFVLWLYSVGLKKKRALTGNIIISLMMALVPLSVGLFEFYALKSKLGGLAYEALQASEITLYVMSGFSVFAFLYNFILNIAKSCENYEGDNITGRKTIPVRIGKRKANYVLGILSALTASLVLMAVNWFLPEICFLKDEKVSRYYIYLFIFIPTLAMIILSFISIKKRKYIANSIIAKLIMLFGILFSLVFYYAILSCISL